MKSIKEIDYTDSIISLITSKRYDAYYTTHQYSSATAGDIEPCNDEDIEQFMQSLKHNEISEITISDISWEESGNCVGDELYPVTMIATKIPSIEYQKYVIEIHSIDGVKVLLYQSSIPIDMVHKCLVQKTRQNVRR